MEEKMFCNQCQEAANCTACTVFGACGKSPETANRQDHLLYVTKELCILGRELRKENKDFPKEVRDLIKNNLFITITNANFDDEAIEREIAKSIYMKEKFIEELDNKNIVMACKSFGQQNLEVNEDVKSVRELITYGIKGLAAYLSHANVLLKEDEETDIFLQDALAKTLDDTVTLEELVALTMETGKYGLAAMNLLDIANTGNYGNPEISEVNLSVRSNPAILISGHDLKDLELLLEQTKGTGVDVYTHCEMLPAHYYPYFKKYDNLVGNYGNAWWQQKEEFAAFNGPILMTTNCIVPPSEEVEKRMWTTGAAGFAGCKHIGEDKDFTEIIEQAKTCQPPKELEKGKIVGGFAHEQVFALADKVVDAVKGGAIKKFVVMAGCDGRQKSRSYYTDFAKALSDDTVILTAGCAKFRYNKLELGDIGGIPRVLDAGQCNDSYSLALIALKLKEVFELEDINDLPIIYNIAWYEQKAVIVLLALLYLGVKNIHLGPTLPAFISPNVANLLVENFGIASIGSVEEDMEIFFA